MSGILSYGAYFPRLRLKRSDVAAANAWFNPGIMGLAKGNRSVANWDEDVITMAIEAGRDCVPPEQRPDVSKLYFASTTFPFLDRLNSGVVVEALGIPDDVRALDICGTQRSATTALISAMESDKPAVVVTSDQRRSNAASTSEILSGDGAAAVMVGPGDGVAEIIATSSLTTDFVGHFRTQESPGDYFWEERWIREIGYRGIAKRAIDQCLSKSGIGADQISHLCLGGFLRNAASIVATECGLTNATIVNDIENETGNLGCAQPLILLIAALERAKVGEKILVVGFGQGVDVLLIEAKVQVEHPKMAQLLKARDRDSSFISYPKFLAFTGALELDRGMRSEVDKLTPLSTLWRNKDTVTAFRGGKCTKCKTVQYPLSRICVNPNCNAVESQESVNLAEQHGRILSYTADHLTYSPDPPAYYGLVEFDSGGRWTLDFTDVSGDITVGEETRMVFRIKDIDEKRGFRRYFWKAAPL